MKVLTIAIGLTLALGLVVGIVLPGLAAPEVTAPPTDDFPSKDKPPAWGRLLPNILKGKVISVGEGFFVIQSRGEELSISVNDDTKYFTAPIPRKIGNLAKHRLELGQDWKRPSEGIPKGWSGKLKWLRRLGKKATFDDITVGAQVLVWLAPEEDNHLAKGVVIIKPISNEYQTVVGTVTTISPANKTITIAPTDGGEAITLNYNDNTRFILRGTPKLEERQTIRAVYDEEMLVKLVSAPIEAIELAE